jgi:hypothetical protein
VPEVREAALRRLADAPVWALLDVLPLVDVLTQERRRAGALDALVEARLADGDLRTATRAENGLARRAAWRRLVARGACEPEELRDRVVRDPDVVVRAMAPTLLPTLAEEQRRAVANVLLGDPVGWLAGHGLDAMVELDGAPAIRAALTARSATLRRRARDWARVRGVDARAVYRTRLDRDPADMLALVGLAEIGHRADITVLLDALADPRARVRAAALKAVAALDEPAAREAAMDELVAGRSGRAGRAAAAVLRDAALRNRDLARLESVVRDVDRPAGQRMRALVLLRPARWRHLAALLGMRRAADPSLDDALDAEIRTWLATSARISRAPDEHSRDAIDAALPDLEPALRQRIAFVLRTAVRASVTGYGDGTTRM